MATEPSGPSGDGTTVRHVLDRVDGSPGGPTLIIMAGIHGNEPAGLAAATGVVARLRRGDLPLSGRVVALVGNLAALRARQRFLHEDLNRRWMPEQVARLRAAGSLRSAVAEDREQAELLETFDAILDGATGPYFFLDLHTSSAEGPPFLTVGDTLCNRRFVRGFPLPLILGLEEQVDGALLEYLNNAGFVTMGVEAGQHDSPSSVERSEAVLWLTLARGGFLPASELPDLDRMREILHAATRGIPRVIEVRRRHAIREEDQFVMEPGFSNFQRVRSGQRLARDRRGPVVAAEHGRVLLPLYQGKGNDGFFLAREVPSFWLAISSLLRRMRLGALLRFLPGVCRERGRTDLLRVDTRVARWFPLELFHLFGYRKLRRTGDDLLVGRRRHDFEPPRSVRSILPELQDDPGPGRDS